jgi:hypothetical protein
MKYATKTLRREVYYSIHMQWIINTFLSVFVTLWQKTYFSEWIQFLKYSYLNKLSNYKQSFTIIMNKEH